MEHLRHYYMTTVLKRSLVVLVDICVFEFFYVWVYLWLKSGSYIMNRKVLFLPRVTRYI